MAKKEVTQGAAKVKMLHPETKEASELSLAHAQRVLDYQEKRKAIMHETKAWVLAEKQPYTIKDGKIISTTAAGDSDKTK